MSHAIQVFVGRSRVLEVAVATLQTGSLWALEQELWVLPVEEDVYDAIVRGAVPRDPHGAEHADFGEEWYFGRPPLAAFAAWISRGASVAYVETEYFGGLGDQGACVWINGAWDYGPKRGSVGVINEALARVGVVREEARDEFEVLGLDRRRANEDFRRGPIRSSP